MFNCGNYLLCALIFWILRKGSLAAYVCFSDAPNPNGCDCFCTNALRPQLEELEAKLEGQLTDLKENFLAVQSKLEGQLQTILNKIENQTQTVVNKISSQQESQAEQVGRKIPPGFERIGSSYFRIVECAQNWTNAARTCREMGGYLGIFENSEEFDALKEKLSLGKVYWLDFEFSGYFVSENFCKSLSNGFRLTRPCHDEVYFICQADNET